MSLLRLNRGRGSKLSGIIPEQVSDIIQESVSVLGKNTQFGGQAADHQKARMANLLDSAASGNHEAPCIHW